MKLSVKDWYIFHSGLWMFFFFFLSELFWETQKSFFT